MFGNSAYGAGAGMHGYWGPDYSHTPAPTPQPQSSPYASSGRSRSSQQHRRRSDQLPVREGVSSFPTTPQPNRGSATPGNFSPYTYSTPSPRPSSFVAAPSPGQEYFYGLGPQGPIPQAPGVYAPPLPSDYEYVSPRPRASPRVRSSPFKSQAQSLHRKHSHIDSAYGGDDDEDLLSCPYCYPDISFVDETQKPPSRSSHTSQRPVSSYKSSPRPTYERDSPNVEFKFNVEHHFNDEAYCDYEELDTNHERLYASYQQTAPSSPSMHPPREPRTRSRNSKTRTPGPGSDHPHSPPPMGGEDIRNHTPPSREAAAAHGIPQGYSTKNWDQQERPIMLLGSVFDANSLGKWIYDWTVFRHGTSSTVTEQSGELWLLLIQLSGKSKRAREVVEAGRIRRRENLVLVNEFLESGDRLWDRMKRLLKHCEEYMWRGAQALQDAQVQARKGSPGVTMGKQSGKEFVDAMFSEDRELERTKKLMTGMKLWSTRFDANCEDILRRPHA